MPVLEITCDNGTVQRAIESGAVVAFLAEAYPADQRDDRTIARYRQKFEQEAEPQVAERLTPTPFICGERFTAADCLVGHSVIWARGYWMCRGDVFKACVGRLSQRPAFAAAFADAREFERQVPQDRDSVRRFTG